MGIDHSNPYIHSTTVLCDINLTARRLLLSVIRPSSYMEYGGEIWEDNKSQVAPLFWGELKEFWVVRLKLVMKVIWG